MSDKNLKSRRQRMIRDYGSEEDLINSKIANYMRRVNHGEKPFKSGKLTLEHEKATLSIPIDSFEDRFEACVVSKLFLGSFGAHAISKILLGWFTDTRTKVKLKFECDGKEASITVFGKRWEEKAKLDKEASNESRYFTSPAGYMLPAFNMMCVELIDKFEDE